MYDYYSSASGSQDGDNKMDTFDTYFDYHEYTLLRELSVFSFFHIAIVK